MRKWKTKRIGVVQKGILGQAIKLLRAGRKVRNVGMGLKEKVLQILRDPEVIVTKMDLSYLKGAKYHKVIFTDMYFGHEVYEYRNGRRVRRPYKFDAFSFPFPDRERYKGARRTLPPRESEVETMWRIATLHFKKDKGIRLFKYEDEHRHVRVLQARENVEEALMDSDKWEEMSCSFPEGFLKCLPGHDLTAETCGSMWRASLREGRIKNSRFIDPATFMRDFAGDSAAWDLHWEEHYTEIKYWYGKLARYGFTFHDLFLWNLLKAYFKRGDYMLYTPLQHGFRFRIFHWLRQTFQFRNVDSVTIIRKDPHLAAKSQLNMVISWLIRAHAKVLDNIDAGIQFSDRQMRYYMTEIYKHIVSMRLQFYIWNMAISQGLEVMDEQDPADVIYIVVAQHTLHCLREMRRLSWVSGRRVIRLNGEEAAKIWDKKDPWIRRAFSERKRDFAGKRRGYYFEERSLEYDDKEEDGYDFEAAYKRYLDAEPDPEAEQIEADVAAMKKYMEQWGEEMTGEKVPDTTPKKKIKPPKTEEEEEYEAYLDGLTYDMETDCITNENEKDDDEE